MCMATKLGIILETINIFSPNLLCIKPTPSLAYVKMISYLCKWHEVVPLPFAYLGETELELWFN